MTKKSPCVNSKIMSFVTSHNNMPTASPTLLPATLPQKLAPNYIHAIEFKQSLNKCMKQLMI